MKDADPVTYADNLIESGVVERIGPVMLRNGKMCENPHEVLEMLCNVAKNGQEKNQAIKHLKVLIAALEPHVEAAIPDERLEQMQHWYETGILRKIGMIHANPGELIIQDPHDYVGGSLREAKSHTWTGKAARNRLRRLHIVVSAIIAKDVL